VFVYLMLEVWTAAQVLVRLLAQLRACCCLMAPALLLLPWPDAAALLLRICGQRQQAQQPPAICRNCTGVAQLVPGCQQHPGPLPLHFLGSVDWTGAAVRQDKALSSCVLSKLGG
jgi:hypothetical protein